MLFHCGISAELRPDRKPGNVARNRTRDLPQMTLDPLLSAAQPIPAHAVAALVALVAGGLQFALRKGTVLHRVTGWLWVGLMLLVALSSFFINDYRWIGPFSPIHILSVVTLFGLWEGLSAARRGDIAAHRAAMRSLYVFALIVAGTFTFLPGRIMHQVVFG